MLLDEHLKRRYSELQQKYNALSNEIEYLSQAERTSNLRPKEIWQLQQQIKEAQQERERINQELKELDKTSNSEQLYRMLLKLGYERQVRLFLRLIQAQSVAAFLIHGSLRYGQRWLLNRLVEQYVPHNTNYKKIRIELSRTVRRIDVQTLWRELGNKVLGKRYPPPSPLEIAEGVYRLWQTENVLLVFHDVNFIPQDYLEQLIKEFWQPLAQKVRQAGLRASKYKLLIFFIDYDGSVGNLDRLFVDRVNSNQADAPVRSPNISKFTEENVTDWMLHEFNELPYELTHNVDDTVSSILSQSDDGIPEDVLQGIFERCGYNYYDEVERLWKL
ncbi:MAG: hypothetical protein QNJ72_26310 [Pleurocapsa sp. MO_226.B13]|nr:hypothetical protein [Pleurocapsa sp. MO_226.B13]